MVVLNRTPTDERRRRAVVHTIGRCVAGTDLDTTPVAEGEQERFVDLRIGSRRTRVPSFQLDGQTDRRAVIELRLADEMNFTFLNELEAFVVSDRAVHGVGRVDVAGGTVEGVVAAHTHLDRVGCHGRGGHQPADDQGGRAE